MLPPKRWLTFNGLHVVISQILDASVRGAVRRKNSFMEVTVAYFKYYHGIFPDVPSNTRKCFSSRCVGRFTNPASLG
jgi:hypothetical protein